MPTVVQKGYANVGTGDAVITFGSPVTPGNTIIIAAFILNYNNAPSVIKDNLNANGTYTLDGSIAGTAAGSTDRLLVYRLSNVGNAPQTITVTHATRNHKVEAYEVSGLTNSSPLDFFVNGAGASGNSAPSFAFTTNEANEFVFGCISNNTGGSVKVFTAGSGWTLDSTANEVIWFESRISGAAGAYNLDGTTPTNNNVIDFWAAGYKEPAAAAVRSLSWVNFLRRSGVFTPPYVPLGTGPAPSAPTGLNITGGSGSATLTWVAPTLNEDGSALSPITKYKIYWGHVQGEQYPEGAFDGGTPDEVSGSTLILVKSLAAGTWYAGVTAFNDNAESFASTESDAGVVT